MRTSPLLCAIVIAASALTAGAAPTAVRVDTLPTAESVEYARIETHATYYPGAGRWMTRLEVAVWTRNAPTGDVATTALLDRVADVWKAFPVQGLYQLDLSLVAYVYMERGANPASKWYAHRSYGIVRPAVSIESTSYGATALSPEFASVPVGPWAASKTHLRDEYRAWVEPGGPKVRDR